MTIEYTERRVAHALVNHPIPEVTHPLGKSWDQPSRDRITLDDAWAMMSAKTFEELVEYSCSQPSGVYPGKMWRRYNGSYDGAFLAAGGKPEWWLCWYDVSPRGVEWCSTQHRKIMVVEG